MNGRYSHAVSPEERIGIAVVAALHAYFMKHPKGVAPGQGFLADFLKPFIERELLQRELSVLHEGVIAMAPRERKTMEELSLAIKECEFRVRHTKAEEREK